MAAVVGNVDVIAHFQEVIDNFFVFVCVFRISVRDNDDAADIAVSPGSGEFAAVKLLLRVILSGNPQLFPLCIKKGKDVGFHLYSVVFIR